MQKRSLFIVFRNVMIPVVLAMLLLVMALLGFIWIRYRGSALNPFEAFVLDFSLKLRSGDLERSSGADTGVLCFTVDPGDTAGVIATKLVKQGFNLDPELFRSYVRFYGIDA